MCEYMGAVVVFPKDGVSWSIIVASRFEQRSSQADQSIQIGSKGPYTVVRHTTLEVCVEQALPFWADLVGAVEAVSRLNASKISETA